MKKTSIRFKLLLITMVAIGGSSLLNIVYTSSRAYFREYQVLEQKAISLAEYAAFNSAPGVVFRDQKTLSEALSALKHSPEFAYAVFMDPQGQTLAEVDGQKPPNAEIYARPQQTTTHLLFRQIHVAVPIRDAGEIVGYLYLGMSLAQAQRQIDQDFLMAIGFNLILSFGIIWLVRRWLSTNILQPISHLHSGTKMLSEGNFEIKELMRRIHSQDEFGQLAESFQEMVDSLSEKGQEILYQNQRLKEREQQLSQAIGFLSTYLPKQLVATVLEHSHEEINIAPQRQELTVFFSDLQGFTSLTDQLAPEVLFQMLNQYQNEMTRIVLKYDGTLDKYMGDGLMVFFGSPKSYGAQEDALRCALMAMEMQNLMGSLREEWFYRGIESPVNLRIGIHSGFSTVGSFGTESRLNYTAIGPGVNLASRLESACPAGAILTTHQTWAHIREFIQTIEWESITPKGLVRPIKTYILQGIQPDLLTKIQTFHFSTELQQISHELPLLS